jgi:hypothetical protein
MIETDIRRLLDGRSLPGMAERLIARRPVGWNYSQDQLLRCAERRSMGRSRYGLYRQRLCGAVILMPHSRSLLSILLIAALSSVTPWLSGCVRVADKVELTSPNGRYVATAFSVNAGATASLLRVVSLRESGTSFSRFRREIFTVSGDVLVNIGWSPEGILLIDCQGCQSDRIEARLDTWGNVRIQYSGVPPGGKAR